MTTATCKHCGVDKPLDQFYWRDGHPRIAEGCKPCYCRISSQANRDDAKNAELHRQRNLASQAQARLARVRWTTEDEKMVAQFYDDPSTTVEELAATLGRSVDAVICRAAILRRRAVALRDRRTATMKNAPQNH